MKKIVETNTNKWEIDSIIEVAGYNIREIDELCRRLWRVSKGEHVNMLDEVLSFIGTRRTFLLS